MKRVVTAGGEYRIDGELVQAGYLIGADGQNSMVRRSAGLDHCWYDSFFRYGFRQHFLIEPWSEFVEVYWEADKQIYVAPVGPREIGVAVLTTDPRMRVRAALDCFPAPSPAGSRIAHFQPRIGRGYTQPAPASSHNRPRCLNRRRVRIGGCDHGRGIVARLPRSPGAGGSLRGGGLAFYERRHAHLFRRSRVMARLLMALSKNNGLRRHVLRAAAGQPDVFASLLGFHVGQKSLLDIRPAELIEFGRNFLTGCAAG